MKRGVVDQLLPGAVSIGQLLRMVLSRTGAKFRLPNHELQQYALLAISKLTNTHPLIAYDPAVLWDKILLGDYDVVLLPDIPAAGTLAQKDPSRFFIVSGVTNVTAILKATFRNLVINEEVIPNANQRKVAGALADESRPSHRAGSDESDPRFASLEWLTEMAAARHAERRDLELARIRDRVLSKLPARHAKVIQLRIDGHPAKHISVMTGFSLPHIYAIYRAYSVAVADALSALAPKARARTAAADNQDKRSRKRKNS